MEALRLLHGQTLETLKGKRVIVRIDSDVTLENGQIEDSFRLDSCLKTLYFLLDNEAQIIIVGHLGRPEGNDPAFSLRPVAEWFQEKFNGGLEDVKLEEFSGWKITDSITLLENIRFYPEEEKNDEEFSGRLAKLGDIYVNEAFGVSHRENASVVGITKHLPSFAGLHLTEEVKTLSEVLTNPHRPLGVLIGGAKIETKLPVVETMHKIADFVMVGGEVAEHDKELIQVQHEKMDDKKSIVLVADLNETHTDITPKSAENFIEVLETCNTIVWNGPVGEIGKDPTSEEGTRKIAEAIRDTNGFKVVGGGDSVAYLATHDLLEHFNFVSTGGGAMLEYLSGKKLPALQVLVSADENS